MEGIGVWGIYEKGRYFGGKCLRRKGKKRSMVYGEELKKYIGQGRRDVDIEGEGRGERQKIGGKVK